MKRVKIGDLILKNPLFLAPMVDVTDLAYRIICRRSGCAMAYTEMLQVEALKLGLNEKALKLKLMTNSKDKPLGIQITGRKVSDFREIIPQLREYNLVDLNCGCPGHLTIDHGSGSYLMKNPNKIVSIIKLLKNNDLTVSVKIRLGFNKNNVLELAKKIDSAGADALTLHPRLASQGRTDKSDWTWFSKVKDNIGIPLIGNGDIFKPQDAKEVLNVCDGVMIARGAIGNPFIFKQTLNYLDTGKIKEISFKDNLKLYLDYLNLARKYDLLKMSKVKYIGGKFLRGFDGAPDKRNEFMGLKSYNDIELFIKELL
jgi:tRNA-dihydrouridine synthase B